MGVTTLLFNEDDAIAGLKSWLDLVLGQLYDARQIRRGQRNAPASSQRQVTFIPLQTVAEDEAWTDDRFVSAQRNLVNVTVSTAAVGAYSIGLLGSTTAPYVAGGGDTPTTIRDALRAAVDALALAVTTADVGGDAFSIRGNVAGVWLAVAVASEPVADALAVEVIDDVARETTLNPGRWTVRILIDDVWGASSRGAAVEAADLVVRTLKAYRVPVVVGSAAVYSGDLLRDTGLDFLDVETVQAQDYTQGATGGPVRHQRAMIDVVFNTANGLSYDLPTIETLGPVSVTVNDP